MSDMSQVSDGYHTFAELYEYRMLYSALAANAMPDKAMKCWRHSDGELCFGGGWFIVVLTLPTGQVTNHYEARDWNLFQIPAVEHTDLPPYDGHTPAKAAERLRRYCADLTDCCWHAWSSYDDDGTVP